MAIVVIVCVITVASAADLPPDTMRQLTSPVSGYRGEIANVEILPDGAPSLPPGPDLPKMAEAALHYLGNNPVPENKYQCRFWNMLLLCPPDAAARSEQGPAGCYRPSAIPRAATTSPSIRCARCAAPSSAERLKTRSTSGWSATCDRRPANSATTCAGATSTAGSPDVDSPYANPWATGKLLQSEVDLYRLTGDESHKKLARRLFEGLRKAASWDTGRAFYPNGLQGFKPGKNAARLRGALPARYRAGHVLLAALQRSRGAGVCPRHGRRDRGRPSAAAISTSPTAASAATTTCRCTPCAASPNLAAETKNARYLEWAKLAYQYYNDNGFDTGWLPEILRICPITTTTPRCAWWAT